MESWLHVELTNSWIGRDLNVPPKETGRVTPYTQHSLFLLLFGSKFQSMCTYVVHIRQLYSTDCV